MMSLRYTNQRLAHGLLWQRVCNMTSTSTRTSTCTKTSTNTKTNIKTITSTTYRSLSYSLQSFPSQSGSAPSANTRPSYQVFGDNVCFVIKTINPEFRAVGTGNTVIVDKKGKLLFEWVPKVPSVNKFLFDRPLRFALSPEEVALVLTKLRYGQSVELNRQNRSEYDDTSVVKVFRATAMTDGSVRMSCDYEKDGQGGQPPSSEYESTGPLEINLLIGESIVVQSIMEYSIPRLTGWTTMLDHSIENSFRASTVNNNNNTGNYNKGNRRDDTVLPF